MNLDSEKTCPSCHKKDFTSFSKCRYCGTSYSAVIKKHGGDIDIRFVWTGLAGDLSRTGTAHILPTKSYVFFQQIATIVGHAVTCLKLL